FFFFSSRRRHTRFSRDWSSDVCSSDLGSSDRSGIKIVAVFVGNSLMSSLSSSASAPLNPLHALRTVLFYITLALITLLWFPPSRSEERRVGKEWSSRWSQDHCRKRDDR